MRNAAAFGLAALLATARVHAQGPIDHLEFLEAPRLVQCGRTPAFRVTLNAVNTARQLVPISMTEEQALKNFSVTQGGTPARLFYVRLSDGGERAIARRYFMLLLDTSGSMNRLVANGRTRFDAAKAAVRRSLQSLDEGADFVSIVPFDSHRVAERIRSARFDATREGIERQLQAIPAPDTQANNTALYSAIVEALPLMREKAAAGELVSLVVFTDGENDVGHPGDDRGLLGSEGLTIAKARVAEARVPMTTVGFNLSSPAGQRALSELAWPTIDNYYDASTNPQKLGDIFELTRRKLANRIELTFLPVQRSKEALAGQTLQFHVDVNTNQGTASSRMEPTWNAPAMATPVYDANCTTPEEVARARIEAPAPATPAILQRLLILAMLGCVLALLWFGAPRLVWPERYVTKPVLPSANLAMSGSGPSVSMNSGMRPSVNYPSVNYPNVSSPNVNVSYPNVNYPSVSRPETSVRLPPRGAARPVGQPRRDPARPPDTDAPRHSTDETVYRPPNKRFPGNKDE